jgi:hypothetical protein
MHAVPVMIERRHFSSKIVEKLTQNQRKKISEKEISVPKFRGFVALKVALNFH